MSCGAPVTTPWLLQGLCLQPHLTPKIPPQHKLGPARPRGQPDPSLHGVFPELPAPGSSPGRDQRGAEPFSPIHPQAGAEHVLELASKQTSKLAYETPDVVSQIQFW